jgi:hypothetical protein
LNDRKTALGAVVYTAALFVCAAAGGIAISCGTVMKMQQLLRNNRLSMRILLAPSTKQDDDLDVSLRA